MQQHQQQQQPELNSNHGNVNMFCIGADLNGDVKTATSYDGYKYIYLLYITSFRPVPKHIYVQIRLIAMYALLSTQRL